MDLLRSELAAELALRRSEAQERLMTLRRDLDRIFAAADTATDDEHDPEGVTAFERAQTQALIDATLERLVELDLAEARLAAGTYGHCLRCGEPIAPGRLAARPAATACIACARSEKLSARRM